MGIGRCSELTLGDCWGIWDSHPEFDDNRGTFLLLIRSEKGSELWEQFWSSFLHRGIDGRGSGWFQSRAVRASEAHPRREEFFSRLSAGEPVEPLIRELLIPKPEHQSLIRRNLKKIF